MSEERPNHVTAEAFSALKARFHGKLEPEAAMETLVAAGEDKTLPPILRINVSMAILELRTGRSVQSVMARFRRKVGLDK